MSDNNAISENVRDDRVLNPEEQRQRMQSFVNEARDLQKLLKTYEQQQRSMEADVAAFVVNEIKEQQVMKDLREEVLRREYGALQNIEYVKFTQSYNESSIGFEETAPTQRMRACSSDTAQENQTGSLAHSIFTALRASPQSDIASWCPDSVIDLRAYGDLKEVLLGWRAATGTTPGELDALSSDAFAPLNTIPQKAARLCCFANGVLCTPAAVLAAGAASEASLAEAVAACTVAPTTTAITAIEVAVRFGRWLYEACAFSPQTFVSAALTTTPAQEGDVASTMFTNGLVGDSRDTLVFVDPARLQDTHLFRVFVLQGEVAAVEHIGAPMDVLTVLGMGSPTAARCRLRECEQDRLMCTAAKLCTELERLCRTSHTAPPMPPNAILVMAVSPEPLDLTHDDEPAHRAHTCGVLLDVCRLSPSVPFRWHLTWGEVCAIGQQRRTRSAACPRTPTTLLKCSNVQAVYLEPFDEISAAYFPSLNARILGCEEVASAPPCASSRSVAPTKPAGRSNSAHEQHLSTFCTWGAAVSVAALAATALRFWSHKK